MGPRLENIDKLVSHRSKTWKIQDYVDAYEDEWEEVPTSLDKCLAVMRDYIYHTYSDELIIDCINAEVGVD
jgi:hypothetical protein